MLRNYLLSAWRNLIKNKAFSFLNISGLAIGMASALLIGLWIWNEVSFDRFHKNGDHIYEAWNRAVFDGQMQYWNNTPKILGPTLKIDYPEVADVARSIDTWFVVAVGEKKASCESNIVDPAFLTMFSFPLVRGDARTALSQVNSIVLTEKMAKRMFGNEDPMGKLVRIDHFNFLVSGVMQDLPVNTRFKFDYLLPWTHVKEIGWDDDYWGNNSCNTFVQLKPATSETAFNAKIRDITKTHSKGQEPEEVFLHPLAKWHLYTRFENGKAVGGEIETIRLFTVVAIFILIIACINFMNLSTARSEKRAKEVGIRKVSGAFRYSLIMQFMGESIFVAALSGLVAILLVQFALPSFDLLIQKDLRLPWTNIYFWLFILLFVLFTGLVAGSYPAFFLSSFQPVAVLKGTFKKVQAMVTPRRILVIVQFTFAIVLVISTLVVVNQIRYAQNRDSGYQREKLVYHFLTGTLGQKFDVVKTELLQSGVATDITQTNSPLTEVWSDTWGIKWQGKSPYDKTDFIRYAADEHLSRTAGLQIVAGRDMDLAQFPTDSTAMLLNQSAVAVMRFKDPIGQLVNVDDRTYHVVGVIKDFIIGSPYEPMRPIFVEGGAGGNRFNVMHIRLGSKYSTAEAIEKMGQILRKYNPEYPFEYHFIDQEYAKKFDDTKRTATLAALFAGLTILISCLGIFGLASFVAAQRTKEIGVRKVLGASVFNLWQMLSKDFIKLVLIAMAIATPIAGYFMNNWLQNFDYRTGLSWWLFASAGLGALLITLATVSYQSIRAAMANPVRSLRSE